MFSKGDFFFTSAIRLIPILGK